MLIWQLYSTFCHPSFWEIPITIDNLDYNGRYINEVQMRLKTTKIYNCNKPFPLIYLSSYPPNQAASPFVCLVLVTGRAIAHLSWPNATARMKCCFCLSWVYQVHHVVCWMIASVAQAIPWPHTGTGGSPRYTVPDPTQTSTLSPCRASTVFSFISAPQTSSGFCRGWVRAAPDHLIPQFR